MDNDLSSLFEQLNIDKNSISPDMINSIMNIVNNPSNHNSNTSNNSNNSYEADKDYSTSSNSIDFDTILKMKSIIDKMNIKNDPRSKLLESLKPYLKESRRDKIDQYVQLMNMSKVIESINLFNGDNNNASK